MHQHDAAADLPRLDGDRMMAWAKMVFQEEQLAQTKQVLASQILQELGYTPGEYLLSDDAYIVSREEFNQRVRSLPQTSDQSSPDSENPAPDLRTVSMVGS